MPNIGWFFNVPISRIFGAWYCYDIVAIHTAMKNGIFTLLVVLVILVVVSAMAHVAMVQNTKYMQTCLESYDFKTCHELLNNKTK